MYMCMCWFGPAQWQRQLQPPGARVHWWPIDASKRGACRAGRTGARRQGYIFPRRMASSPSYAGNLMCVSMNDAQLVSYLLYVYGVYQHHHVVQVYMLKSTLLGMYDGKVVLILW